MTSVFAPQEKRPWVQSCTIPRRHAGMAGCYQFFGGIPPLPLPVKRVDSFQGRANPYVFGGGDEHRTWHSLCFGPPKFSRKMLMTGLFISKLFFSEHCSHTKVKIFFSGSTFTKLTSIFHKIFKNFTRLAIPASGGRLSKKWVPFLTFLWGMLIHPTPQSVQP